MSNDRQPMHLRIARATNNLQTIAAMYKQGLGFEELGNFGGHDGIDGVMLGHRESGYHLEFTQEPGVEAPRAPGTESLLVFYLPDAKDWKANCARMSAAGFQEVPSSNPYWERAGRTFEDPEGYRVVLQNARWP